jgi:hypothetical protein
MCYQKKEKKTFNFGTKFKSQGHYETFIYWLQEDALLYQISIYS